MAAPEVLFTIGSIVLVLACGLFGGVSNIPWSHRTVQSFHVVLGITLLVLVVVGLWLQYRRVKRFQKVDYISASHLILFGLLAFAAAKALRRWGKSPPGLAAGGHGKSPPGLVSGQNYLVTYKGKPYDLKPFLNQHPGGKQILEDALLKPGRPMDVESLWKQNGVSWHQHNPSVQQVFAEL